MNTEGTLRGRKMTMIMNTKYATGWRRGKEERDNILLGGFALGLLAVELITLAAMFYE